MKRETLEQGISEQTVVIKVNKSEFNGYSNDGKTLREQYFISVIQEFHCIRI